MLIYVHVRLLLIAVRCLINTSKRGVPRVNNMVGDMAFGSVRVISHYQIYFGDKGWNSMVLIGIVAVCSPRSNLTRHVDKFLIKVVTRAAYFLPLTPHGAITWSPTSIFPPLDILRICLRSIS